MDQRNTPTTSYKEVKIGKTIYRVTSFFSGEKDLGKTLEQLAVRRAMSEVSTPASCSAHTATYLDVQELDREIVEELIDHIEIGERSIIDGQRHQDIKIFYRFVGVV